MLTKRPVVVQKGEDRWGGDPSKGVFQEGGWKPL